MNTSVNLDRLKIGNQIQHLEADKTTDSVNAIVGEEQISTRKIGSVIFQLAIEQCIGKMTLEDYAVWLSGQKAMAETNNFLFATRRSTFVYACYKYQDNSSGLFPKLGKGQQYVWLDISSH